MNKENGMGEQKTAEDVSAALQRAFSLGQRYWRLADSESYSDNRLSDNPLTAFKRLVAETVAALSPKPDRPMLSDAQRDDFDCALGIADALAAYCRANPRSYRIQQGEEMIRSLHAIIRADREGQS